jgi:hypothetical protein
MWTRAALLMFAVGCVGADAVMDDPTAAVSQDVTSGFTCSNNKKSKQVICIGSISILPIFVIVKNVKVLNNNQLNVLSDDLNNLAILDGNILDQNKILNDVEVTVLQDFLNKFLVSVTKNDIDVCTDVLGGQICK